MELINSVNIDALYALASKLIVLVGVMAFLVSVVTQMAYGSTGKTTGLG